MLAYLSPGSGRPLCTPVLLWAVWVVLAAGLAVPWGLARLPPSPGPAPLPPQALATLAYGLGISLAAAALWLRKRHAGPAAGPSAALRTGCLRCRCLALFAGMGLAHSMAWLGYAAWLADSRTPAFSVLLAMAAATLWLVRPRAEDAGAASLPRSKP